MAEAIAGYLATAEVLTSAAAWGLLTATTCRLAASVESPVSAEHHGGGARLGRGARPGPAPQLRRPGGFTWRRWAPAAPATSTRWSRCAKLAFADREAWYGDPAAFDVPIARPACPAYTPTRRASSGPCAGARRVAGRAGPAPPSAGTGPPTAEELEGSGEPTFGDTCHVDVADRHGNLVAATPSGGWLQSSPTIPGLGFCLGTRAQMLWLEEGLASSLRPRTRPRTTLSPSMALRDGEPCLAFGTPGGDAQDQWTLQFFLAHTRFGLDLQQAVDTPSFQSDHFPSSFWPRRALPGKLVVEAGLDPVTIGGLRQRGHLVEVADHWSLGRTCAAGRDPATGFLVAAANPRGRQAYAVGR